MKKWLYSKEIFKYLTSKEQYKLTYLILIFAIIYARLSVLPQQDLGSALILPFAFPVFHFFIMVVFYYNTMTICKILFSEFDFLFIRYKSRYYKIKILILNVLAISLFSLIIFLILYVSIIVFTYTPTNNSILPYRVPSLYYAIYYIFKVSIILILFQIFNALIYFLIKEKSIIILIVYFIPFYLNFFSKINEFYNFAPWLHQLSFVWKDAKTDVISFVICIMFLNITLFILYKICRRKV